MTKYDERPRKDRARQGILERNRSASFLTTIPLPQHPSDVDLQRLADDGIVAVSAVVVAHVRDCAACANLVRYARAARATLRDTLPELTASDELLQRIMRDITNPNDESSSSDGA